MRKSGSSRFGGWGVGPQIVGFVLVLGLLGAMAIQPTRQLLQQKERIEQMDEGLANIRKVNGRLADRIERLRDPDYIEQRAREQIGLVRPGETAYVVMPPSGKSRKRAKPEPAAPVEAAPPSGLEGFLSFLGIL